MSEKSPRAFLNFDDMQNRLFKAVYGTMDLFSIYLGDKLSLYSALKQGGPATSGELASRAGTEERYTREWLEQQAVTGFLACDNPEASATARRYALPEQYEEFFLDSTSLNSFAPYAQIVAGTLAPLSELVDAFRTGAGVPYENYGRDLHEGQARVNRALFVNYLAETWIPAMPDIHARLQADPPARIADIGMGQGWSSIELAKGYPNARIDGFDLDDASVAAARENLKGTGFENRISFQVRDAGDPALAGQYDFALAIECVHDMNDPVSVLSAMRRLVGAGGTVLIVDELAEDEFRPHGKNLERVLYGFSIFHCLPVGRVGETSVATGTVMRTETFRGYANVAGYANVEVLSIESDNFRFYRLTA